MKVFQFSVANVFVSIILILGILVKSLGSKERDKRFVRINPDSSMTLGFLWNAPVALILPTVAAVEYGKFDKLERSDDEEEEGDEEHVGEGGHASSGSEGLGEKSFSFRSFKKRLEKPEELYVDPGYIKQTDKLMTFFSLLMVPHLVCQERIICEMAFDTHTYSPVSEYMLRELKLKHGPVTQENDSLMWRYVTAARHGISATNFDVCGKIYEKCPLPTYKILNVPVIKVWQYIATKIKLSVV